MNTVNKHLCGVNFRVLPLEEKLKIKKMGRPLPDLKISQTVSSRGQQSAMQRSSPDENIIAARGGGDASRSNASKPQRMSSAEIADAVNTFVREARKNSMTEHPKKISEKQTKKDLPRSNNPPKKEIIAPNVQLLNTKTTKERKSSQIQAKVITATKDKDTTATISMSSNNVERPSRGSNQRMRAGIAPTTLKEGPGKKQNAIGKNTGKPKPVTLGKPELSSLEDRMKRAAEVRYSKLAEDFAQPDFSKDGLVKGKKAEQGKREILLENKARMSNNQAQTSAQMLDYLSSASSEDEGADSRNKGVGPDGPPSPASEAKVWNEINNSPGPSFPGWKFRPPAQDKRLNQIGSEDLSKMFKNAKTDNDTQTDAPRRKMFSEYMKKFHPNALTTDESITTASLEERVNLKKTYAEQLEAMQKKALASLQSLNGKLKKDNVVDPNLDVLMEGTSRQFNPNKALQLQKDARKAIDENTLDEFARFTNKDVKRTNENRRLAHGDGFHNREISRRKFGPESTSRTPISPSQRGDASVMVSDLRDLHRKSVENSKSSSAKMEALIKSQDRPLHKLNKISEMLKLERPNRISKKPTSHVMRHTSSDTDSDIDFHEKTKTRV